MKSPVFKRYLFKLELHKIIFSFNKLGYKEVSPIYISPSLRQQAGPKLLRIPMLLRINDALKKARSNEDGFTLIELLIVIIIIGILAAIAIPIFLNQQKAAINASVQSDVRNTESGVVDALNKNYTATGFVTLNPDGSEYIAPAAIGGLHQSQATIPAGEVGVTITKSRDNVITISGDYSNYKVCGANPGTKYGYSFDSTTGHFGGDSTCPGANSGSGSGGSAGGGSGGGSGGAGGTPESGAYSKAGSGMTLTLDASPDLTQYPSQQAVSNDPSPTVLFAGEQSMLLATGSINTKPGYDTYIYPASDTVADGIANTISRCGQTQASGTNSCDAWAGVGTWRAVVVTAGGTTAADVVAGSANFVLSPAPWTVSLDAVVYQQGDVNSDTLWLVEASANQNPANTFVSPNSEANLYSTMIHNDTAGYWLNVGCHTGPVGTYGAYSACLDGTNAVSGIQTYTAYVGVWNGTTMTDIQARSTSYTATP
jgi:type IV pilus assembly protein PilA